MSIRFQISILIFMMAILFGVGIVIVLATPLSASAMKLIPWVVGVSTAISAPVSWMIAPRLRARFWKPKTTANVQGAQLSANNGTPQRRASHLGH